MKASLRTVIIAALAVAAALAGGGGFWVWHARHASKPLWRTGMVRKGDLTATITATGTVEPEEVVDVGAQVSGQFLRFGKDRDGKPIDYGSIVTSNMLLAEIDTTLFKAAVDLDTAVVASDKAGEQQAAANVEQMKAKEAEAEADWKRAQKLGEGEALAPTTYDQYKATYEIAKANMEAAIAAVASAKAATQQAEANLARDKQTLAYCTIYSPVDGVIIDRRVTIGETVASSLNTPSLFLIAKDLKRIQVWASVNEADIGNIHPGQDVTFTVDAFPNRVFRGKVNKVRFNATMNQNVVTYTVEVNTDNSDGRLLPYLTANVNFLAGEATNALLVLNSALRWHPQNDLIAPAFRPAANAAGGASTGARASENSGAPAGRTGTSSGGGPQAGERGSGEPETPPVQTGTLWAQQGNYVRPVPVKLGLTDGTWTQVEGEGLAKGTVVVTGTITAETAAEESEGGANPFLPQVFQRRGPTNAIPMRRGGRANGF
ncbi:MAG: efflux RND transporter periplasmic adaptor subunit [Verrucomicrobiota bacterium]|jgi:HlyD family secretion protein